MDLSEIVAQIVQAGLSPNQVGTAASIVSAIQAAGLNPADVAQAVQQAVAPPAAPALPAPADATPTFAYLQYAGGEVPTITTALLAVSAGIDAGDHAATMTALMDLYRSECRERVGMTELFTRQRTAIEAAKPKPEPEPEPLPIEPAPLPVEPIEEVKP